MATTNLQYLRQHVQGNTPAISVNDSNHHVSIHEQHRTTTSSRDHTNRTPRVSITPHHLAESALSSSDDLSSYSSTAMRPQALATSHKQNKQDDEGHDSSRYIRRQEQTDAAAANPSVLWESRQPVVSAATAANMQLMERSRDADITSVMYSTTSSATDSSIAVPLAILRGNRFSRGTRRAAQPVIQERIQKGNDLPASRDTCQSCHSCCECECDCNGEDERSHKKYCSACGCARSCSYCSTCDSKSCSCSCNCSASESSDNEKKRLLRDPFLATELLDAPQLLHFMPSRPTQSERGSSREGGHLSSVPQHLGSRGGEEANSLIPPPFPNSRSARNAEPGNVVGGASHASLQHAMKKIMVECATQTTPVNGAAGVPCAPQHVEAAAATTAAVPQGNNTLPEDSVKATPSAHADTAVVSADVLSAWRTQSAEREDALRTRLGAVEDLLSQWQAQYQLLHQQYAVLAQTHLTKEREQAAAQAATAAAELEKANKIHIRVERSTSPVCPIRAVAQAVRCEAGEPLVPVTTRGTQGECKDDDTMQAQLDYIHAMWTAACASLMEEEARGRDALCDTESQWYLQAIEQPLSLLCAMDAKMGLLQEELQQQSRQHRVDMDVVAVEAQSRERLALKEEHHFREVNRLQDVALRALSAAHAEGVLRTSITTLEERVTQLMLEADDALQREKVLRAQLLAALRMPTTTIHTIGSGGANEAEAEVDCSMPIHRRFARAHQEALKAVRAQLRCVQ